jgi:hypothetical protein
MMSGMTSGMTTPASAYTMGAPSGPPPPPRQAQRRRSLMQGYRTSYGATTHETSLLQRDMYPMPPMQVSSRRSTVNTGISTEEAQEDQVLAFLDYKKKVNRKLGPILRQLVNGDLLTKLFSDVHDEMKRPGGKFNATKFFRLAQMHYCKATPTVEVTTVEDAMNHVMNSGVYGNKEVRLDELTASVKAKITVARDIAHAGNGDDDMTDIYYARLLKSLVLIGLHNSRRHSQIFADIRFLDTLRNCRDANWSETTWSEVIDHVQIYEAANQERNYDGSLAYSSKSSPMVTSNDQQNEIPGEVIQQIKINDCRKEISTWTLEEMKGRCFTCGEVPCLHKQEDGKCAGKGTVTGRANSMAAWEHKKNLQARNEEKHKANRKAMIAKVSEEELGSSSEEEEWIPMDSIPVHNWNGKSYGYCAKIKLNIDKENEKQDQKLSERTEQINENRSERIDQINEDQSELTDEMDKYSRRVERKPSEIQDKINTYAELVDLTVISSA